MPGGGTVYGSDEPGWAFDEPGRVGSDDGVEKGSQGRTGVK
jgi:hypothetical protein